MIGYLLFGGILILLAIAVVAAAVRSGKSDQVIADPVRARKDVAIEALRALEFEFQTGKLAEEEYGRLRRELEVEAVRARDDARAGAPADRTDDGGGESAAGPPTCANCGNDLAGGESFCPSCGAALR
jgi:hypothetical protein